MSILKSAYVKPLPLDCYIFSADFVFLEWTGSQFTATWPDFVLSEADNSAKVGDIGLNLSVVYQLVGNQVGKTYYEALPDDLLANWYPYGVFLIFILLVWFSAHLSFTHFNALCILGLIFVRVMRSTHRTSVF